MTRRVIARWTWRSVWGWLLCSALCVGWVAPSRAETAFLPVDEAFRLSVSTPGESAVLSWHIAPGYYLYASRVSVQVADGETLEGEFLTPAQTKQDPYFGTQAVFHDQAQWQAQPALPAGVDLTVRYQGCAEAGLCYPPQVRKLSVPEAVRSQAPPVPTIPAAEADGLAEYLKASGWLMTLLTCFALGLGLTFTPCVLPMVPILSSIIVGQRTAVTHGRAFSLSTAYVLGMASTYTALGVAVGFLGARANLQAAFQQPWVLGVFAALFVGLALAMFGVYELQLPAALRDRLDRLGQRSQGGQLAGVAVMGLISALVVSPCVSAPLAGVLLYISSTGDAWLGGAALFALAMGMGVPLIAIGTTGARLLPRAGAWMERVKHLFGVGLLIVALGLLDRVLPVALVLLLWGLLLLAVGLELGAWDLAKPGWARVRKAVGMACLLWGALLVIGAARGEGSLWQPLPGALGATAIAAQADRAQILFETTEDPTTLTTRIAAGKPVMLDIYADWCASCKVMEREVYASDAVQAQRATVQFLKLDVTAFTPAQQALLETWKIPGPPAVLFFGAGDVQPQGRLIGEATQADVLQRLSAL